MYTQEDFDIFKETLDKRIKKELKFQTINYSITNIEYEDKKFIFSLQSYLLCPIDNTKTIMSDLTIIYNSGVILINTHNNSLTFYELNTIQNAIKNEMLNLQ